MREFTREEIIASRFDRARRGYDPMSVDEYLEDLAEYIGWLRTELAQHRRNEGAALELLRNAQRVADEKLVAAALGVDQYRAVADAELSAARAESTRLVESARVEGGRLVAAARSRAAEIERESHERLAMIEQIAEGMSEFVNTTAIDLRSGGSRLQEIADGFQFELTARSESFDGDETVDLR